MKQLTLVRLIMATHRLGRVAALSTGNTTPVAQWRTLSILGSEGPMRMGELALASRVSQPGMTRLVAQLAEEELIARVADSDDARAWQVRLTPKGERALATWQEELGDALLPLFEQLDPRDWATLDRAAGLLELATRTPQEVAS